MQEIHRAPRIRSSMNIAKPQPPSGTLIGSNLFIVVFSSLLVTTRGNFHILSYDNPKHIFVHNLRPRSSTISIISRRVRYEVKLVKYFTTWDVGFIYSLYVGQRYHTLVSRPFLQAPPGTWLLLEVWIMANGL